MEESPSGGWTSALLGGIGRSIKFSLDPRARSGSNTVEA